ncbi:MAG: acyl-CoA dehydrogenase family protein [Thermodesulfobacteriota bacterium]
MLNFSLSSTQISLRQKAREFAHREVLPVSWYFDEKDEVPLSVLKKAYKAGFLNSEIPEHYGGLGSGLVEAALVTEEISAACPGIATSVFDNALGLKPILLSSNESLKERIFSEILREFKLICFATSEPTMGSDVAGMQCRAKREGKDFLLSGTKYWITNAGIADYMVIFATVDPAEKHKGIGAFLVERKAPGVSVSPPIPKLGQRCSNTGGIRLQEVRVPAEQVLAPPGEGFVLAMRTFGKTRPIIGAFAVGAARSAMEYALDYAKKRHTFGHPLAQNQAIQFKLAEMVQMVETARLLVWKAAWETDQGLDNALSASMAKFYGAEMAMKVVQEALQIFGGYGYTRMFPIEKLFRDIRLFSIYEGTDEIQRSIVAAQILAGYRPVMPPLEDLPLLREWDPSDTSEEMSRDRTAWRCRMCGHVHYGPEPPGNCPYCFFPKTMFKKIWPKAAEG